MHHTRGDSPGNSVYNYLIQQKEKHTLITMEITVDMKMTLYASLFLFHSINILVVMRKAQIQHTVDHSECLNALLVTYSI